MTGLPNIGERVKVWPHPARSNVQDGARPVDQKGGGRWLATVGREVVWSEYHVEQLLAGDIFLHDPSPAFAPEEK